MPILSESGVQLVNKLAQQHQVSTDAVTHMLIAIQNGNGTMAQFNHSEFGGSGQWMRGGMTMVSDLFNHQLKYRVDSICNDISNALSNHQLSPFRGSFQSQSQNGVDSQSQMSGSIGSGNSLFAPDPEALWWPSDLGSPNATGSQNNVKYAYFSGKSRLAVKTGNDIWVYDTQQHQIGGFAQQQGAGGSITFTSQFGIVSLSSLPVVLRNGVSVESANFNTGTSQLDSAQASQATQNSLGSANIKSSNDGGVDLEKPTQAPVTSASSSIEDVISTLNRLGELKDKGYITDEEFAAKKAELLSRI